MRQTLYERLGGDAKMQMAVSEFLAEIGRDPDLSPFFDDISVSALGVHQIKLFRVRQVVTMYIRIRFRI